MRIGIASAMASMARWNSNWGIKTVSSSCTSLLSSPSSPILPVWCGPCLPTEKKMQTFKSKCLRKLLRVSHFEHKTYDSVQSNINFVVGQHEPLLATVKTRRLACPRHVRCHDSLSKTILQGTLESWRHRGRQRTCWMDSIKETPLPTAHDGIMQKDLKRISAESSLISPRWPYRSRDWTELDWYTHLLIYTYTQPIQCFSFETLTHTSIWVKRIVKTFS